MAGTRSDKEIASWTDAEVRELLEFLLKNKATLTDAGNFKAKTYTSAASTIANNTKTAAQVKTKWINLKGVYRAIQHYKNEGSGLYWHTPENANDIGRGANITTPAEDAVWKTTIKSKWAKPLKKYRNEGWPWLWLMQQILPVAGATGAHAFAPSQSDPAMLDDDDDQDIPTPTQASPVSDTINLATEPSTPSQANPIPDIEMGPAPSQTHPAPDVMEIDSTEPSTATTPAVNTSPEHPPAKRKRRAIDDDKDNNSGNAPTVATTQALPPKMKKTVSSRTTSTRTSVSSSSSMRTSSSTRASSSQRVPKMSAAVAFMDLNHNVDRITRAIELVAQAPLPPPPPPPPVPSVPDPAQRRMEAFARAETSDDGLTDDEKASLIVHLTEKPAAVEAYLALKNKEVRLRVIKKWIAEL